MKTQITTKSEIYAEFYWHTKIQEVRAEGERLRYELRRRGIDPALILEATRIGRMARRAAVWFALFVTFGLHAQSNDVVTIVIPRGVSLASSIQTTSNEHTIRIAVSGQAHTNNPGIQPNDPTIASMALRMRLARQLAEGQAAPWNQRFIVTKVEEFPRTRVVEDEQGLPLGMPVFSTNYAVTVAPVSANETNAPVAWGLTKTKQLRFFTTRPAKKGDEYDFFPIQ